jgi:hypothetical protein
MQLLFRLMLLASGLAVLSHAERDHSRWPVRDQETIEKTLTLSVAPMRVVVDNVDGYIHVKVIDGSQVHVVAHKVIHADDETDVQQAKNEVKLLITEQPGTVTVYYDAPWRCNGLGGDGCHDQQRRFYNVTYDIDVEVPRGARPIISTVNNGDIRVDGTTGDFEVKNVNGGISMTDVSGSGEATTVNGPVTVHFTKNPTGPCAFKSINGHLDFYFQPDLSADLRFKTFNGQIYSDFDVTALAVANAPGETHEGKFVYHSNAFRGARAGHGGPELTFDAFNGNIRLHRAGQGATSHE